MFTLIILSVLLCIAAPFIAIVVGVLRVVLRGWVRWRHVPLAQKNHTRAGVGGFLCVLAAGLAAIGWPPGPNKGYLLGGLISFGLLYLCVGVIGSQGARFDVMSALWWGALGLGCAALLIFKGIAV